MLIISLIACLLVCLAACSLLSGKPSTEKLPQLADVNFGSDYEIQHISGYPEANLIYVKTNRTYIVSTHLRTFERFRWHHFWRIDNNGNLIDSFATREIQDFSLAGIYFEKNWYNDWLLTGEKKNKPYQRIIHSKDIDTQALNNLFAESEQILWDQVWIYGENQSQQEFHFYLKNNNDWILVRSDEKLFKTSQESWPPISHVYFIREHNPPIADMNEGKLDAEQVQSLCPIKKISLVYPAFTLEKNISDNLQFTGFKKSYSVRPGFMAEQGWEGKVGAGNYQLTFDQNTFDFTTYTNATSGSHNQEKFSPALGLIHSLPEDEGSPFLLLKLLGGSFGTSRDDTESGIYILRKKYQSTRQSQQVVSKILFKEFTNIQPVLRWVMDANGLRSDWPEKFLANNLDLPAEIKSFPTYIDFYFDLPKSLTDNSEFTITINDHIWSWKNPDSIYMILYFDAGEMENLSKKLGKSNLTLTLTAMRNHSGLKLIPELSSAEKSIHLRNVRIVSDESKN